MADTSTSTRAPSAHPSSSVLTQSGTFDPADWLARYTALGGVYVANGKLNLCILVNNQTEDQLSQVRELVVALTDDDKAAILAHINAEKAPRRVTWEDVVARYERAETALENHPAGSTCFDDPGFEAAMADQASACAESRHAYLGLVTFPAPDYAALRYKVRQIAGAYELDDEALNPLLRDIERFEDREADASKPAKPTASDNVIAAAWEQRRAAYSVLSVQKAGAESSLDETKLWGLIKASEDDLQALVATSPSGVASQLWAAMHHVSPELGLNRACESGNLAALEEREGDLDICGRLILAALRSLKSMGA